MGGPSVNSRCPSQPVHARRGWGSADPGHVTHRIRRALIIDSGARTARPSPAARLPHLHLASLANCLPARAPAVTPGALAPRDGPRGAVERPRARPPCKSCLRSGAPGLRSAPGASPLPVAACCRGWQRRERFPLPHLGGVGCGGTAGVDRSSPHIGRRFPVDLPPLCALLSHSNLPTASVMTPQPHWHWALTACLLAHLASAR